jgi:tyrosyl-tRNA synthetase
MDDAPRTIDEQVDLLLRGTFFADEADGPPADAEASLRTQMRKELRAKLQKGRPLRVYLGVDPTATSLHIGHLVPALKLRQFQLLGHQAVFLIGDYTGLIGDPSGQSKERPQLTAADLAEMSKGYADQVFRILDRDRTEVRRNSEWLARLGFADVIKLAAIFPLKQIIARREFQERMDAGKPLRFHEALYPLMQGYDAHALEADVQVGGYDQHFNLLAGREIQVAHGREPHVMLTLPLLQGTDGRKMSKSYGNSINVADTPRDMYGKVMRISDDLIPNYLDLTCMLMETACNRSLHDAYESGAMNRIEIKEAIGEHVVGLYFGAEQGVAEREWFREHIRQKKRPDDVADAAVTPEQLAAGADWATLLLTLGLVASKAEVRRLIQGGGFRVEDVPVTDPHAAWDGTEGVVVQFGKRRFVRMVKAKGA